MRSRSEAPEVYRALVAELSETMVPTSIMGLILIGIGLFSYGSTGLHSLLAASIVGGSGSTAKIMLLRLHARRNARGPVDDRETLRWELPYALTTAMMAASIGTIAFVIFMQPNLELQLLATSLIFGYTSGLVARVGIRPWIASPALAIAVLPSIAALSLWPDATHRAIALIFTVFLLGALESVRHVHRRASRAIRLQLDMATLARNDPLTGLINRLGLREVFRDVHRTGTGLAAIHYMDLDGFKGVNDRLGHAVGDLLLTAVAHTLRALMPAGASVARIGGDEFVIFQPVIARVNEVDTLARRVNEALRMPFDLAGHSVQIGVSLGFTVEPISSNDLDGMLRRADEASYRVKRAGGGVAAGLSLTFDPLPAAA